MLIIVPSVRAWRKIVMDVPKLSTLVPVEQTYSMNGVVSVRFSLLFVRICLTDCFFQVSRRVSLRHYSSSEILLYYAIQIPTKYDGYKSTTDSNGNQQARVVHGVGHVMGGRWHQLRQVYHSGYLNQRNLC